MGIESPINAQFLNLISSLRLSLRIIVPCIYQVLTAIYKRIHNVKSNFIKYKNLVHPPKKISHSIIVILLLLLIEKLKFKLLNIKMYNMKILLLVKNKFY